MPLFGSPNIEKLAQKQDVEGLIEALKHDDFQVRRDAAEALAQLGESRRLFELVIRLLEPIERQVGAIRPDVNGALPRADGGGQVSLSLAHVPQMDKGRHDGAVGVDRGLESARRFVELALLQGLEPDLVLEKRED